MSSVAKRPNGKWRARVRLPDGKQRARHFDRKVDAEQWLARQVVKLADGTWVDPMRGKRTFRDYAAEWVTGQVHHRASTAATNDARMRGHVLPRFGDRPIASIQRSEVQAWVKAMSATLSPSYVEGVFRLFAQVMLAAVDDGVLVSSPCGRGKVKLPEDVRPPLAIPTVEQVRAFVDAAPEHAKALIVTAAGTGMRIGEVTGLTVDRIDFLRRQVRVDRQLVMSTPLDLGPVKTKASNRTIPLADELVEVLARHVEDVDRHGLVFTNTHGRPWRRNTLGREWHRWGGHAGTAFKPHDLRHFYASSLIAGGQSVKVIQARLGHATAQETLDTYGHLWHDDEDRTRGITAAVVAGVLGKLDGSADSGTTTLEVAR